jgi:3-hydroxyisobutyrate dehydrogenase-like beta-hydroxyacid dehydrogenase
MAQSGKLIFVTPGPQNAREKIAPYLTGVMGRSVIDHGEDQTMSSLLKIIGSVSSPAAYSLGLEFRVL